MSGFCRRFVILVFAVTACATVSQAYYHFIHFTLVAGQRRALPEKFDLNSLPSKTLSYFVGDAAAVQFAPSDTFAGLVSQIRAAAQAWNDVETSDLRLAFGGFVSNTPQSAPTLEVLFEEVPPGLVAMGGPTVRAASNETFVPILKSVVIIRPDLTQWKSFTETFFGTLVHELGHALGLQHTLTSSVMSTAVTRTTSKGRPLTADDMAGLSLLYPSRTFFSSTGSIAGRVLLQGGQPVNIASVVAISPAGAAISTLTNPDGTFRIDGLPPRAYYVYVHPLPPPGNGQTTFAGIVYPTEADGRALGPGVPFDTAFFRGQNDGTNEPDLASPLAVGPGTVVENVNFTVRPKNQIGIHSVETFSYPAYPAGGAVKPAYLSASSVQPFIVARGEGLTAGAGAAPGLRVKVLSGPTLGIQPFATPQGTNLQLYFDPRTLAFSTETPRHLVFSANNDIYVQPSGFFHVQRQPPAIASVLPGNEGGIRSAAITGINFVEGTRILFDGAPALVRSFDEALGRLTVIPPPAPVGHRANVTALNPDGQSSLFVNADNPPAYTYAPETLFASAAPVFLAAPSMLPAGVESMIQIDSAGTNFVDGMVSVGFGTSDVVARRVWVVSPTRLLVNVSTSSAAQVGGYAITIASGLNVLTQPFAMQVLPLNARAFWLRSGISTFASEQASVTAGSIAVMHIGNAPAPLPTSAAVFLNDQRLPILGVNGTEVAFQIPAGTAVGPAVVRVEANGERSMPIVVAIDPPPPRIISVTSANQLLNANRPAHAGEMINLYVTNLLRAGSPVNPSRLVVSIGGIHVNAASVSEAGDGHKVTLVVPSHSPVGADVPLSIQIDERSSEPVAVAISE
jgi:uncharacterized protein (TIGR03437 family)